MPKSSAKESACSGNNYRRAADYQRAAGGRGARGAHLAEEPVSDGRKAAPSVITVSG